MKREKGRKLGHTRKTALPSRTRINEVSSIKRNLEYKRKRKGESKAHPQTPHRRTPHGGVEINKEKSDDDNKNNQKQQTKKVAESMQYKENQQRRYRDTTQS